LKGEIEKKNQFKKKIKRIKIKFEKITYHKLGWNNEIEILQKLQEKKL
jgi:hypothetical protein